jgi:hypothetical protein
MTIRAKLEDEVAPEAKATATATATVNRNIERSR